MASFAAEDSAISDDSTISKDVLAQDFLSSIIFSEDNIREDLIIKESTIENAGFGLFANREFKEGEIVCKYTGTVHRTAEAICLEDKTYLMRLGEQCYVDAKDHLDVHARYINDCGEKEGLNVRFLKLPELKCAHVIALRDIPVGEEFFVDYGRWYWIGEKPNKIKKQIKE